MEHYFQFYQIAFGWLNNFIIFILVLIYFPNQEDESPKGLEAKIFGSISNKSRAFLSFYLYFVLNVIGIAIIGILFIIFFGSNSQIVVDYAFTLGIIASLANIVQWTPQIIKTFRDKNVGSLSIIMLLLQAPGSFLVVYFQAIEYHSNVSTWLTFLITGIQQSILLILCIYYEIQNKIRSRRKFSDSTINDESRLLLQSKE